MDRNYNTSRLHEAALSGNIAAVRSILSAEPCDEINAIVCGFTALHLAAKRGHVEIVSALLGKPNVDVNIGSTYDFQYTAERCREYKPGRVIIAVKEETERVRALLYQPDVARSVIGNTFEFLNHHHAATLGLRADGMRKLSPGFMDHWGSDYRGFTALHFAAAGGHYQIVKVLLDAPNGHVNVMQEDESGKSAIELAHEKGFEQIETFLTNKESGKRYMDNLYRDRQVYVDAANAILVGAALIASVTFAAWLQPPLNYTLSGNSYLSIDPYPPSSYPNYADVEHNIGLGVFWVFNSLSFYFAVGTVVLGACSVLPRQKLFIKRSVVKLRRNLLWTSCLLALSVLFVLVAFGTAGVIVLMPILKFRLYMIVPSTVGGLVCLISLGYLFYNILEESWWRSENAKNGGDQRTSKGMVSEKKDGLTEGGGSKRDSVPGNEDDKITKNGAPGTNEGGGLVFRVEPQKTYTESGRTDTFSGFFNSP